MKNRLSASTAAILCCIHPLAAQTAVDLRTQTKNIDFSGAGFTRPFKIGISLPVSCLMGEGFFKSDLPPGKNLYLCGPANNWSQVTSGSIVAGSSLLKGDGQGNALAAIPGADYPGLDTTNVFTGYQNLQNGTLRPPESTVAALPPAGFNAGRVYVVTDAASAGNCTSGQGTVQAWCRSNGTAWIPLGGSSNGPSIATTGSLLKGDSSGNAIAAGAGADFAGLASMNVFTGYQNLQNGSLRPPETTAAGLPPAGSNLGRVYVVTDALNTGGCTQGGGTAQVLCRSNGSSWGSLGAAAGAANIGQSFTSATAVVIAHNANTLNPLVVCYDNSSPPVLIEYNRLAITDANTATVTFTTPQSGRCVVNTSGGGGGSGGGTISAAAGLTGDGSPANPVRVDPSSTPGKLVGSITWQPGSNGVLAAATCNTTTIGVPGAAVGDTVAEGWPIGTFSSGANALVTGKMWVSSANTVTVKVCNSQPSGSVSFVNDNYRVMVVQ